MSLWFSICWWHLRLLEISWTIPWWGNVRSRSLTLPCHAQKEIVSQFQKLCQKYVHSDINSVQSTSLNPCKAQFESCLIFKKKKKNRAIWINMSYLWLGFFKRNQRGKKIRKMVVACYREVNFELCLESLFLWWLLVFHGQSSAFHSFFSGNLTTIY